MKYLYGFVMILSLVGSLFISFLGAEYWFLGYGLHPALAGMLIVALLSAGYVASVLLERKNA